MHDELPFAVCAEKGVVTVYVDEALLGAKLAPQLACATAQLLDGQWRDTPATNPRFDLRICRVREPDMTSGLRVDAHDGVIDFYVEPTLMAPELPELLAQATMEISKNFT